MIIPALDPQVASAILIFGLVLKIIGFMIRDELLLRSLVATGLACDLIFYLFRETPITLSVGANAILVTINVVLILIVLLERTTWRMSTSDLALFAHFNTLTPGQFRRLRRHMRDTEAAPGTRLTIEGKPVADLMLVFAQEIVIAKGGQRFPIAGPTFVGEIAFLTGDPSSADVIVPEGGKVIRLESAELKARMARAPALRNAMIALFGDELARKVAYSVPMPRAVTEPTFPDAPVWPVEDEAIAPSQQSTAARSDTPRDGP